MKVAIYYNNNDVRVEDWPMPDPKVGELLVKTKACGVCVADTMEWYLVHRAPLTLGHEPTGIVVKTGKGVKIFKEGDRVAVHHHVPCLICEHCRRGNYTMCSIFRETHIYPGGFSEYFTISPVHVERDTHILPDHVSFKTGTLLEPLACVIHAIRKADIKAGETVVLIGTGTMGLMFIQSLLYWGIRDLVVYEILDWRQKKALEFGAPHVLSPFSDSRKEANRLKSLLKSDGADKVIVAAKDIKAMELGMQIVNKGGTILFFATPKPDEFIKLFPSNIFFKEITITSSYSANHLDTRIALKLISNGSINAEALISHTFLLEKLSDAIIQTASRQESLKCVIIFNQ